MYLQGVTMGQANEGGTCAQRRELYAVTGGGLRMRSQHALTAWWQARQLKA